MKRLLLLLLSCAVVLLTGCSKSRQHDFKMARTPAFKPGNAYRTPQTPLPARVAMLPLYSDQEETASLRQLDGIFRQELDKMALFEMISISRDELHKLCGKRYVSPKEPIPHSLLEKLRERYAITGVMFTDITHQRSYPPLALGVRAKLYNLEVGALAWVFDTLFDLSDPHVHAASKHYLTTLRRAHFPLVLSDSVYQSPSLFGQYVAHAVYSTLKNQLSVASVESL